MALDTKQSQSPKLRWSNEENELLLGEWLNSMTPAGRAGNGFVNRVCSLLPNRTRGALLHQLRRLAKKEGIPPMLERNRAMRTPLELDPSEAAWLAGVLDADGCVTDPNVHGFRHLNGREYKRVSFQLVLCYNTDMGVISKVSALVPGASTYKQIPSPKDAHPRKKPIYHVTLNGFRNIEECLRQLLPYMAHTRKRERAVRTVGYIGAKLNGARYL